MMTSRSSVLSVLAVTTILLVVQASSVAPNNNPNPVSTTHRIELHHSLHTPLDKSQVYWLFGGATVLTKKFIRLTPSTQDRRGWLWNEYPLESDNWEVEFKTEVFSKPHFGGDGFGFWVLSGDHDPSAGTNPDALIGPIFGMRNDFNGIGVMFDVYDNDNRRNNPNVFVLKNDGSNKKFNHDNDFEDDMFTTKPNIGDEKTRAHRCVADLRNTGKPARVLVKYLHKILHVYIETNEVSGWKFCLAVQFDKNFADHHLVFTAATGQVADNMDLLEVNTRYLAEGDAETDDARFARLTERSGAHRFSGPFWTLMTLFGLGLLVYAVYEFATFRQMMGSHIDAVRVCQQFNKYVLPHYAAHGLVAMLLLFSGNWWALFLNLPLLAVRGHAYATKTYLLTPNTLGGGKSYGGGGLFQVSNATRQTATIVYYAVLQIYYFNRLVSAL